MSDLRVGEQVSFTIKGDNDWSSERLVSTKHLKSFVKYFVDRPDLYEWQRGLHASLIPDGFMMVEKTKTVTTSRFISKRTGKLICQCRRAIASEHDGVCVSCRPCRASTQWHVSFYDKCYCKRCNHIRTQKVKQP